MKKNILIIGGVRVIHEKFKNYPVKLTLIHNKMKLRTKDSEIYDRIIGLDSNNKEEWIKIAEVLHNIEPFDCISAYHELNQDIASEVARKLSIPFHDIRTINIINNKFLMREALKETYLNNVKYAIVKNKKDIEKFLNENKGMFILKPISSWGSTNIFKINSYENNKVPDIKEEFIIETYAEGEEFSVESISINGKHQIVSITKKYIDEISFVEKGHSVFSKIEGEDFEKIKESVKCLLDSINFKNGASHTEVKLDKGKVFIIETHSRMGGDYIPELISYSTGCDFMDAVVRVSLNKNINFNLFKVQKYCAIWFKIPDKFGKISSIKGIEKAEKMEGVISVNYLKQTGDIIPKDINSFDRLAYIIASGKTPNQAIYNAKNAMKEIDYNVL